MKKEQAAKIKVKHSGVATLAAHGDARGGLFVAEAKKHVPFQVKRVYFMNGMKGAAVRGGHAHKKTTQAFFCASGSFKLNLDDGARKQSVALTDPAQGVIVGPKLWHTMSDFSKNCVILVLADDYYKAGDYVRDYDDFKKYIKFS